MMYELNILHDTNISVDNYHCLIKYLMTSLLPFERLSRSFIVIERGFKAISTFT